MNRFLFLPLSLLLFLFQACETSSAEEEKPTVDFDRREMLAGWVDDVYIPAYTALGTALDALESTTLALETNPTADQLGMVQSSFIDAYLAFQKASPFVTGRAEVLRFREQCNTYPTNTAQIERNATEGGANLDLPSQIASQGFPAIEYLLFGQDNERLTKNEGSTYRSYLLTLVRRMQSMQAEILADWQSNRQAYIENDGNSATASIDRTVNDFIFYYEKSLRAGKIGIPAGVFSDTPLADRVEGLYAGNSKALFTAALDNTIDFFANHGLKDYLDAQNIVRDGELLSDQILSQWARARSAAAPLQPAFRTQVETDNVRMLQLYDELQRNVVLLKVDMLQALSINVDFVDADGD